MSVLSPEERLSNQREMERKQDKTVTVKNEDWNRSNNDDKWKDRKQQHHEQDWWKRS